MQRADVSEKINVPHMYALYGGRSLYRTSSYICPHCIIMIILIPSPTGASYKHRKVCLLEYAQEYEQ